MSTFAGVLTILFALLPCTFAFAKDPKPTTENEQKWPISIVIYDSDRWMEGHQGKTPEELSELFGAKAIIVPNWPSHVPEHPKLVDGIVWHQYPIYINRNGKDIGDGVFIQSNDPDKNPALTWEQKVIRWRAEGLDLYNKKHEGGFLDSVNRTMSPHPTMSIQDYLNKKTPDLSKRQARDVREAAHKVTEPGDYSTLKEARDHAKAAAANQYKLETLLSKIPEEEREQLEKRIRDAMAKYDIRSEKVFRELLQLETLRRDIHRKIGKSIIKPCFSCHSEGVLPRTHKDDWIENYLDYTKDPYSHKGFGGALSGMLTQPDDVILQKLVDIEVEARVHLVMDKAVDSLMSIRNYPELGEYLTEEQIKKIKHALEKRFIPKLHAKLGPEFKDFMATLDAVITKDSQVMIIDLNAGTQSGYMRPWSDVLGINYLMEYLSGETGPLLKKFYHFAELPAGSEEKIELGKKLIRFIHPHTPEGKDVLWRRFMQTYLPLVKKDPTVKNFEQAIQDSQDLGIKDPRVVLQFINQVQDTIQDKNGKPLRLSPKTAAEWRGYIENEDPKHLDVTLTQDGKIQVEKKKTKVDCMVAAKLANQGT